MYLAPLKTLVVKATRAAFNSPDFPVADFASANISVEYPISAAAMPSIWIDFSPSGPLKPVGIGHREFGGDPVREYRRWSFAGSISFTVNALGSLERDRLYDAMVAVIAFGEIDPSLALFRSTIEGDPLIDLTPKFDEIDQQGFSVAPGTPWGTDELLYEATLAIDCIGEFVSSPGSLEIVPLAEVTVEPYTPPIETDPSPGGEWFTNINE